MAHDNTSHPPLGADSSNEASGAGDSSAPLAALEYNPPAGSALLLKFPEKPQEYKRNSLGAGAEADHGFPHIKFKINRFNGGQFTVADESANYPAMQAAAAELSKVAGDAVAAGVSLLKDIPGLEGLLPKSGDNISDVMSWMGGAGAGTAISGLKFIDDNILGSLIRKANFESLGPRQERLGTITLFLPHRIQENYGLNWSEAPGGFAGAMAVSGWGPINDIIENGKLAGLEVLGNLLGGLTNNQAVGDLVLRTQAGVAVNPQAEQLFKGVQFRRFSYDFIMSPKSKDEARTVANIVRKFKFHSAPQYYTHRKYGRFFRYPDQFAIEYFNRDATHTIDNCALTNMTVNYSSGGNNQLYRDGKYPLQTQLTLNFVELQIQTKETINEGR